MVDQGEWKLVSRRRRYPENWREKTTEPQKPATRPFVPYTQSYAQAAAMPVSNQPARNTRPIPSSTTPPTTSPPSSPTHRPPSQTYISPHSPTALRFPPSPFFVEWRGRCFRCCRTGHAAASCRFPAKCGKCWADGHVGSRCKKENSKQVLNPAAKPFRPAAGQEVINLEPSFDNMLTGTYPYVPPVMPEARSLMHTCFVERDAEYYAELERLSGAIVVNMADGLAVEKIAELIASSGMVKAEDLSFASLTRGRYLVHLPNGLSPAPVIRAIPAMAWEIGLDFQEWSPLETAAINIPNYKLILNILEVPPHLYREKHMIRATSGIGLYLGTVAQAEVSNIATWTAVVATDNLERVPPAVTMVMGGMQQTMPIRVLKVSSGPIYSPADLPTMPVKHKKPMLVQSENMDSSSEDDGEDLFTCSTKVLQNLCEGRDPNTIPSEIKAMLAGVKRPRLSKEDLINVLLHHEPEKMATDDPSINPANESEPLQVLDPGNPVTLGVPTLTQENFNTHDLTLIHKPHGIPEFGETSESVLERTTRVPNTDELGDLRRQNVRSCTVGKVKTNKGKARLSGGVMKPVPMKKPVKRADLKTRYGQLHRKPHSKGSLNLNQQNKRETKFKENHERSLAPLSRDFISKGGGVQSNASQQYHARVIPQILKRKSDHLENGLGPGEGNNHGPATGIDLQLNPEGFYSVHLAYDRVKSLANGCGLNESDVDETVIAENQYLKQASNSVNDKANPEQHDQQDFGERVCTDPMSSDDEETETD